MFFLSFATLYPPVEVGEPNVVMQQLLRAYAIDPIATGEETRVDMPLPKLPVLAMDPAEAAEGEMWINGRDGKLKAVVGGRTRVVGLQSDRLISAMPQLGEYVRFAAMMCLGIVVAFQIPVAMLVMGWTGLFDPRTIGKLRKFALFGAFAVGAILTPTDLFSMVVLAVPLYGLFEFGLLLMRWVQPRPAKLPTGDPPVEL
jgi:sec-independent protein translocase protein TatC